MAAPKTRETVSVHHCIPHTGFSGYPLKELVTGLVVGVSLGWVRVHVSPRGTDRGPWRVMKEAHPPRPESEVGAQRICGSP